MARRFEPDFKVYAAQVIANARVLAEELMKAGFRLISGGTDNHLVLIDMTSKGLDRQDRRGGPGPSRDHRQQEPDSVRSSASRSIPSGIRMGTPALTTRGIREDGMKSGGRLDRFDSGLA